MWLPDDFPDRDVDRHKQRRRAMMPLPVAIMMSRLNDRTVRLVDVRLGDGGQAALALRSGFAWMSAICDRVHVTAR